MTHALARWRGDTRDVYDHRLAHVFGDVVGRGFLIRAADLADEDDAFGLRIGFEERERVDEIHAAYGIATDADTGGLAETVTRGLVHGLVGERAGTRHDAGTSGLVNEARHDPDLALARRDDAGAVRTDETTAVILERGLDPYHVEHGNAFGDAHDERDARVRRLEDGVRCMRRGHVDHADVGARRRDGFAAGVEHGPIE